MSARSPRRRSPTPGIPIAELSARLAERTDDVVSQLYPAAVKTQRHWQIGDVYGAKGQSLYIKRSTGNWTDASTGQHGDLLDLVQLAHGKTKGETVTWAKGYLGINDIAPEKLPPLRSPDPQPHRDEKSIAGAQAIWRASRPAEGTLTEAYLRSRAITLPPGSSLRFHPALAVPGTRERRPALVAAVSGSDHKVTAVHRIYLRADGQGKAAIDQPKMSRGPLLEGAVRLAPAGKSLGLAEGVETAMSAMELSGVPVWAALGTRMAAIAIPDDVERLVIFADRGDAGIHGAAAAVEAHTRQGRTVEVIYPAHGKDFNDQQQHYADQGLSIDQQRAAFAPLLAAARSPSRPLDGGEQGSSSLVARPDHPGPAQTKESQMDNQLPQFERVQQAAGALMRTDMSDPAYGDRRADLVRSAKNMTYDDWKQLDDPVKTVLSAARKVEREGHRDGPSEKLMEVRLALTQLRMTPNDDPVHARREADVVNASKGLQSKDWYKLDQAQRDLLADARANEKVRRERGGVSEQLVHVREAAAAIKRLDPAETEKLTTLARVAKGLDYADYRQLSQDEKTTLAFAREVVKDQERQHQREPDKSVAGPTKEIQKELPTPAPTPELANLREQIREIREFKGPTKEKTELQKQLVEAAKAVDPGQIKTLDRSEARIIQSARQKVLGVSR